MHGNLHSNSLVLWFSMDEQMRLHLVIMTNLLKVRHFSSAIFSETKSVAPKLFFIFGVSTLWPNSRQEMKKFSPQEDSGTNFLKNSSDNITQQVGNQTPQARHIVDEMKSLDHKNLKITAYLEIWGTRSSLHSEKWKCSISLWNTPFTCFSWCL